LSFCRDIYIKLVKHQMVHKEQLYNLTHSNFRFAQLEMSILITHQNVYDMKSQTLNLTTVNYLQKRSMKKKMEDLNIQ